MDTPPPGEGIKGVTDMMADKTVVERFLKTARGQIDGILKMIEEDRYCVEISNQILAADALLKKANCEVLSAHLKSCVRNAERQEEKDQKIDELISILTRISK